MAAFDLKRRKTFIYRFLFSYFLYIQNITQVDSINKKTVHERKKTSIPLQGPIGQ